MRVAAVVLLLLGACCAHAGSSTGCKAVARVGPDSPAHQVLAATTAGEHCLLGDNVTLEDVICTVEAGTRPPLSLPAGTSKAEQRARGTDKQLSIKTSCNFDVRPGAVLTITGRFQASSGAGEARDFTVVFEGPAPRQWLATFGLLAVENQDDEFFVSDGVLARKRNKGGLEFAPALLWAYPLSKECGIDGFCGRLVAGIGANAERVLPFVGIEGSFGQNVGITAGLTLTERSRLRGEYTVGQTFTDVPQADALVEDKLDAALYIGITMRFDKSPFGG